MVKSVLSEKINKLIALLLIGFFIVFSPSLVLAEINQPVSAPVSIPVTVPAPTAVPTAVPAPTSIPVPTPITRPVPTATPAPLPTPVPFPGAPKMVYPADKQVLDLEGAYLFKVKPVIGASGYLFGLFQDGKMIYENYRDNRTLSRDGTFAVWENNPFHAKFHSGTLTVMIRAYVRNQWTDARTIYLTLKPRAVSTPTPVPAPTATPRPTATPTATPIASPSAAPRPTVVPSATPSTTPTPTAAPAPLPTASSTPNPTIAPTTVPSPALPDLTITGLNVPTIAAGTWNYIQVTVKNQGNAKYYNMSNVYLQIKGYVAGVPRTSSCQAALPSINPGASQTVDINCITYASGINTITATVDYNNAVRESNETNNQYTATFATLTPQISSLWPARVSLNSFFIISGKNFGTSGKVNFYQPGKTASVGSAKIYSWSDTAIYGTVPSSLKPNQIYTIRVSTNASTASPLLYRYIYR